MKLAALALAALLLAAGISVAAGLPRPTGQVLDTWVLLQWGHGALDWLLPDPNGDNDDKRRNRG